MRKAQKKEGSKNLHLGFYFGILVFFIILVSVAFKIFDTVKSSKFDGNNFFTVAVVTGTDTHVISVSPKESNLKKLVVKDAKTSNELRDLGIPYDSLGQANENISASPKSYFTKILMHKDGFKSDLTIIDIVRLSLFSQKADGSRIEEQEIASDDQGVDGVVSKWFEDPQILKDDLNIEITNTTPVPGLGNKFAKAITNMGGSVVLVNSSPNPVKTSKIYYKNDSYTLDKLSKILDIPIEKKEVSPISDIVIEIGEDKGEY